VNTSFNDIWEHPEVERNNSLLKGCGDGFCETIHATWVLKDGSLKRRFSFGGTLLKLFAHAVVFSIRSVCYDMAKLLEMSHEIKLFGFLENVELRMPVKPRLLKLLEDKKLKEKLVKLRLWKMIRDTRLGQMIRKLFK
jgi:hypothetical protein